MMTTRRSPHPAYAAAAARWRNTAYAATGAWLAVHTLHLLGELPATATTAAVVLLLPLARAVSLTGWCHGWQDRGLWELGNQIIDLQATETSP